MNDGASGLVIAISEGELNRKIFMWLAPHRFPWLTKLAAHYQKPLNIFDLESTDFLGVPHFGITEVGVLLLHPDGRTWACGELVNPGPRCWISPTVRKLNGITMDMVRNQEEWGVRWAPRFARFSRDHILTGFNTRFDVSAVEHQNARYNTAFDVAATFDTRQVYWHSKAKPLNSRGKLVELFNAEALESPGQAHRALADVLMTAMLLNRTLEIMGTCVVPEPLLKTKLPAQAALL